MKFIIRFSFQVRIVSAKRQLSNEKQPVRLLRSAVLVCHSLSQQAAKNLEHNPRSKGVHL